MKDEQHYRPKKAARRRIQKTNGQDRQSRPFSIIAKPDATA